MTIIGIAGCTALIVAAFGLKTALFRLPIHSLAKYSNIMRLLFLKKAELPNSLII